jgi:acyl carrier protein
MVRAEGYVDRRRVPIGCHHSVTIPISPDRDDMYSQQIRSIIAEHARLPVNVDELGDESDLYRAGLTSLSTVNLMLALEEHFNVEFLDRMLGRKTFGSIRSLAEAIAELRGTPNPEPHDGASPGVSP